MAKKKAEKAAEIKEYVAQVAEGAEKAAEGVEQMVDGAAEFVGDVADYAVDMYHDIEEGVLTIADKVYEIKENVTKVLATDVAQALAHGLKFKK